MSTQLIEKPVNGVAGVTTRALAYEAALVSGDLSKLSIVERGEYYNATCESLGLNPLTQPFQYIALSGKLTLYATRACTDQLRKINGVSLVVVAREKIGELYSVSVRATDKTGRVDEATGVVTIGRLSGDALANALMKAETKAKRRATLSICGLGWLDESEIETIPQAARDTAPVVHTPSLEDGGVRPVVTQADVDKVTAEKAVPTPTVHSGTDDHYHESARAKAPAGTFKPASPKQQATFERCLDEAGITLDNYPHVLKILSGFPEASGKNVSAVISAFADNGWQCPDAIAHLAEGYQAPIEDEYEDDIPY